MGTTAPSTTSRATKLSRSLRNIAKYSAVAAAGDGLDAFLRRTEILVCLLPATPGMLDLKLIRKLKRDGAAAGAYLINAARGALQVDRFLAGRSILVES